IENGGWSSESSLFACKLIHTIPYLGKAEFEKPAGEPMVFHLLANNPSLKTGQAALVAAPPVWKSSSGKRNLGFVPVKERKQQVEVQGFKPERMLAELFDGQELIISRKPRYGGDETTRVAITPIGFRAAYRDYTACLAALLPVNFEQIQRTSIYFGSDQFELTPSEQNKLDNIVTYLKADPIAQEFFIDGHTDSVGSQPDNLALAQKRAETVSRYLIKHGMPKDAFWVRWHGERYPVASNKDRLGRAKNRRVTIRLETEKTQAEDKGDSAPGGDTRPAEPGAPAAAPVTAELPAAEPTPVAPAAAPAQAPTAAAPPATAAKPADTQTGAPVAPSAQAQPAAAPSEPGKI
ncbi:MAG TPA: OmpA family protein, partial [Cellvibrionaceae bacterium]|nr:OmpA family protein [Cellvibrionaceae bacterium]